ncbi:MAG: DNA polymerase III subunit gamma/tau [Lachnospiraceae bacterium]|nr:DNA polymerase III subunit gamma/tau [Lachnospiraceae bacterium]MDE6251292.1 DNA polymerase III subunit gamma/tau [Lachnospiraceae bacterium]
MSYTALYRKFRPNDFEGVKGQEHITSTLKNQINAQRIGHAYLFCGTRGTGKTSVAKIFARAVNCMNPVNGNPCNECEVCRSINAGVSMNVIEMDAASNNGVENIRQIVDEVKYSPTEGKYKVYIIDEVHMLSIGAFNALLKTLEEPPSYVIFILATTEVHKIPITILSRCQRYDFKRINVETIAARMRELCDIENMAAQDKALKYIAKAADGSMRDALSLLDQCSAFYMDKELTYENVLEVLGAVDMEVFSRMLNSVMAGDTVSCIHQLDEIVMIGRDLSQFVSDFVWYLRNLMLISTSENAEEIVDASAERLEAMKKEAAMISIDTLMRYIRIFSELISQLKYASQKRVLIEVALIKLTRPAMEKSYDSIIQRLDELEQKIESGEINISVPDKNQVRQEKSDVQPVQQNPKRQPAIPEEVKEAAANWGRLMGRMSSADRAYLRDCKVSAGNDNKLYLVFQNEINYTRFINRDKAQEREEQIEEMLGEATGKAIEVEIKLLKQEEHYHDQFTEVKNAINMDIEEEDF